MSTADSLRTKAARKVRGARRRLSTALDPEPPRPPAPKPNRNPRRPVVPEHRYVVVVTYGRSGSTLVQGLLNTLPRTLVRGETGLWLIHPFRTIQELRAFRELHLAHRPRAAHSAFFGLHEVRTRLFTRSTRALLVDMLLGDIDPDAVDTIGFKEVDWHRIGSKEGAAFFDWFDKLLPDVRYVLQERNVEDVVGSGFWKGMDQERVAAKIKRIERLQAHLRRTRPDRVLDLRYERLTSKDTEVSDAELRSLAEFVHGSCDDELLATLRQTLSVGHGPFPFGESRVPGAVKEHRRKRAEAEAAAAAAADGTED